VFVYHTRAHGSHLGNHFLQRRLFPVLFLAKIAFGAVQSLLLGLAAAVIRIDRVKGDVVVVAWEKRLSVTVGRGGGRQDDGLFTARESGEAQGGHLRHQLLFSLHRLLLQVFLGQDCLVCCRLSVVWRLAWHPEPSLGIQDGVVACSICNSSLSFHAATHRCELCCRLANPGPLVLSSSPVKLLGTKIALVVYLVKRRCLAANSRSWPRVVMVVNGRARSDLIFGSIVSS
jgi:hypothetical protein